jgi:arabinan endo-1,5-alpha-L-arabinosidase
MAGPASPAFSLHNHTGAHDPTAIQKSGNTYWIFTTGNGIYSIYSRDLISWTAGKTPFTRDIYPAWINDYVPGFDGHFWAPECIYMNGKYHLYYSCSTWGSKTSCIGLVTNETLNPGDPDYLWVDEGVVVYSNSSSDANCIDPSVFQDDTGNYYMTYGSYFGGIRIVPLDSITGKPAGPERYPVASGNCEASYVIPREGYYYLFINRGSCCRGVNSTYHIQVGRSPDPQGPFLDKSGVDLNSGGGSTILSTNGSFIGPGHVGYFVENGEEWVTYHYYDGDRNGAATLAIGTMMWEEDGWPQITNDFLDEGAYLLVNHNSQMVIRTGDPVSAGNPVVQGSYGQLSVEQWYLTPVGNGFYSISNSESELVIGTEECQSSSSVGLNLGIDQFMPCQHWRFERTNQLEYVISLRTGNYVMNVPQPAFEEGTQLETAIYSGIASHYWAVRDTSLSVSDASREELTGRSFTIFPNPSPGRTVMLSMKGELPLTWEARLYNMKGQLVEVGSGKNGNAVEFSSGILPGTYLLRINSGKKSFEEKVVFQ